MITTVLEFTTTPWGGTVMDTDALNTVECQKDTIESHGDSIHVESVEADGLRFTIKSLRYAPIANIEAWCRSNGGLVKTGYSFDDKVDGVAISFFGTSYADPANRNRETIFIATEHYPTVAELFFYVLDFDEFKDKMAEMFPNATGDDLYFIHNESDKEEVLSYLWKRPEHRKPSTHELEPIYNEDPSAWLNVMQIAYAEGATKEQIALEHPYAEGEAIDALLTLIPKQQ